ncbi:Acetyl-coenzyme A synthetase [Geodia barretti]|uniref:acetate--CoA ligase n=1 Tax=Geodia barretti TaxID=519541 RepID=A0AA35WA21_GEOBA|nr:Acetyl-coenzyme A synthetase [Geodia barretti]
MVQQGQIDHLLQESGEIPPPPHVVEQATMSDYDGVYARSIADPEGFWAEAAEELHWFRKWDDVFQWDYPNFRWFVGGQTNIAYNALDRHLNTERRNKAALIWLGEDGTEQVYTYARLAQQVNRFANGLKSLGVGKGDRVVIYMPLTPEGAISMLACARIGAIHSVVYAGFSVGSLRDRIQDADAKALITGDYGYRRGNRVDLKGIADEAVVGCDRLEHVIVFRRELAREDLRDGETDFDELMANNSIDCPAEVMDAEDPLYILYTSGTTGTPKGVVHVHGGYMVGTHYHFKNFWDVKDKDVFWCMSDIGWVVGHSYIVYAPLVAGATTVFREGAPDFPHNAIFYEEPASRYNLRSLRFLTCAGEPLNPEALRWAYEHICGSGEWAHMVDNWWQTETGGPCLGTTATMTTRPGRVGKPLPGAVMDIVDREGEPIEEPDKGGFLVIRRPFPHFSRTVWGNPDRFADTWNQIPGVYSSGDVALRDADGYYMVVGRADDVLNVAGHRIGSAEVESALVSHPEVAEAAVIGKPDELRGEVIKGFVTLRMGSEGSDRMVNDLQLHVRRELGPIAVPSEIEFTPTLPKTRSGKIMRRLLKAQELGLDPGDITTLED